MNDIRQAEVRLTSINRKVANLNKSGILPGSLIIFQIYNPFICKMFLLVTLFKFISNVPEHFPCGAAMANFPVQSRDDLYGQVGLYSTNDPEQAKAVIVTAMIVIHQKRILATDQYHGHIPLHTHLIAIPIIHFGNATKRRKTVLPRELAVFLNVEVIQTISPVAQCSFQTLIPAAH